MVGFIQPESDLTLVCQHILAAGFDPREDERQRKSRRPNCSLLTRHLPAIHPALRRGVFVLSQQRVIRGFRSRRCSIRS